MDHDLARRLDDLSVADLRDLLNFMMAIDTQEPQAAAIRPPDQRPSGPAAGRPRRPG